MNKQQSAKLLKTIYESIFEDNYDKSIFEGKSLESLENALDIILNNQTSIGHEGFDRAVPVLLEDYKKAGIITEKGTKILLNPENSTLMFQGKNDNGGDFDIRFSLSNDRLKISNNCEVYKTLEDGTKQLIVCEIPEEFDSKTAEKHEISYFVLPNTENVRRLSAYDALWLSSADSSITRTLGRSLTENEKTKFKKGEVFVNNTSGSTNHAYYDTRTGTIVTFQNNGETLTAKSYILVKFNGAFAVKYTKDEVVKFKDSKSNTPDESENQPKQ